MTSIDLGKLIFSNAFSHGGVCADIRLVTLPNGDQCISKSTYLTTFAESLYSNSDCLKREIEILGRCNHPNIIELLGFAEDRVNKVIHLFIPFAPHSDLLRFMEDNNGLDMSTIKSIFHDMVRAIEYLHNKMKICHRDIKPENVLIFGEPGNYVAKVCDFGFSNYFPVRAAGLHPRTGTPLFAAPGLLEVGCLTNPYKNDIWALGVTLYHMIYDMPPYGAEDDTLATFVTNVSTLPLKFPDSPKICPSLKELLVSTIQKDELRRFYIDDVIKNEWLNSDY